MTSVVTDDVLAPNFDEPLYLAVMECVPAARALVVRLAAPWLRVLVESTVLPSLNTSEPLGDDDPDDGVTLALRVTDAVAGAVLGETVTAVEVETAADDGAASTSAPATSATTATETILARRTDDRTLNEATPSPRSLTSAVPCDQPLDGSRQSAEQVCRCCIKT